MITIIIIVVCAAVATLRPQVLGRTALQTQAYRCQQAFATAVLAGCLGSGGGAAHHGGHAMGREPCTHAAGQLHRRHG